MNLPIQKQPSATHSLLFLLLPLLLYISPVLADGIRQGLLLSARTVIPAVFPAMLLTDRLISLPSRESPSAPVRLFVRFFRLPPAAIRAIVIGALSGYPIGASVTARLSREGLLTDGEAKRLLPLANQAGPSFLIAGVGAGLLKDARLGLILLIAQWLAVLTVGRLLAIGCPHITSERCVYRPPTAVRFTDSICQSALRCVELTGFLALFTAIGSCVARLPIGGYTCSLILALLEVTTATAYAIRLPRLSCLALCAFAIGCSGLSVYAQSCAQFTKGAPRLCSYALPRLFIGFCSSVFCLVLYILFFKTPCF